jgi:hypothetical protein
MTEVMTCWKCGKDITDVVMAEREIRKGAKEPWRCAVFCPDQHVTMVTGGRHTKPIKPVLPVLDLKPPAREG